MAEMWGAVAPQFSGMLPRTRLVQLFKSQSPPLTLICAAAGYGKTVFAAQLARCDGFDAVIWVQLPDVDVSGDMLLRQVADVLDQHPSQNDDLITESARSLESVALEDVVRIRDGLREYHGLRVLLLIDGVSGLSTLDVLTNLAADLIRHSSPESRVVVSCRRAEHENPIDPGMVWVIEEGDLAFTLDEVRALLVTMGRDDVDEEGCRLVKDYLGHPAITRIMLRHGAPVGESRPRDLIWQIERIVSCFSETEIAALYLAAVLGEGELAVLQRCALAGDLKPDWLALSRSVPLFCIFDAGMNSKAFKAHAILCNVVERLAMTAVGEEDRDNARALAFEQLSHDRCYMRLAAALGLYGTEHEVARWCEVDGASLIRHAGHSVVARLLARLSPLSISSSTQLLLLRSHVQRASGNPSAALESAMAAKRVAEVGEDRASLVSSTLLLARLYFDQGQIAESRDMLEKVEARLTSGDDIEASCLVQAYLAVSDGQAGRLQEATDRVRLLAGIARYLDQGSDEAVFVANCVGAVACHCIGNWGTVATTLAPIAARSDVAPFQQAHVRSNYAAALLELGDLREAVARAESAVSVCKELGICTILPYAAATLSDVLYMSGDLARGREAFALAFESFERSHDQFGLATFGISSARTLRALGQCDESLSCAIHAESFLAGYGPSVRMLHLMASIEVGASYLALGDVALATTTIDRVLTDPVIPEALGHSLRCDLVLAELDRLRGDAQAAIERLERHSNYIRSGSASMTLACYIRAFPGLLGLLDEALGETGISARVRNLLTVQAINEGLAQAGESLGAEYASAMLRRYTPGGADACANLGSRPTPIEAPFLRVRTFGKLEIESSYGRVEHRHWRKRKSRLLFLMLLCAPSHEIPREVILERLWPDMTRSSAQRNLYVTWSHLRKALACETEQEDITQFADSNSDAYWLTSLLRSDLDHFHTELGALHVARAAGDGASVIASATRLDELYRGELLPVDIYEEWFEEDRTRTRRDFADAMVAGAQAAVDAQHYDRALVFLKRVSAIDAWREDVYQLMMRCQMSVGQRSGAIETYNACRARLVDDLGIDPCAETVRIFQAVLAMEEKGCFESSPSL